MLGGSNCKVSGGKKAKVNKGGSSCGNRLSGGRSKIKGGGLCIGNLHPFNDSQVPATALNPLPMSADMAGGKNRRKRGKRKPTAYNIFMKSEIKKVKKANPSISHIEAFKRAAGNWKSK